MGMCELKIRLFAIVTCSLCEDFESNQEHWPAYHILCFCLHDNRLNFQHKHGWLYLDRHKLGKCSGLLFSLRTKKNYKENNEKSYHALNSNVRFEHLVDNSNNQSLSSIINATTTRSECFVRELDTCSIIFSKPVLAKWSVGMETWIFTILQSIQ